MLRLFLHPTPLNSKVTLKVVAAALSSSIRSFINVAVAQMNFGGELFPSAATISYLFPLQ